MKLTKKGTLFYHMVYITINFLDFFHVPYCFQSASFQSSLDGYDFEVGRTSNFLVWRRHHLSALDRHRRSLLEQAKRAIGNTGVSLCHFYLLFSVAKCVDNTHRTTTPKSQNLATLKLNFCNDKNLLLDKRCCVLQPRCRVLQDLRWSLCWLETKIRQTGASLRWPSR